MTTYIGLLRAINVGGTGKLPMAELRALCEAAGFTAVRTYIQSGNVLFESKLGEKKVKAVLEKVLATKLGKPYGALVRTGEELDAALANNPFELARPNQVLVLFLDEAPPRSALTGLVIPGREEVKLAGREVFIHYPDGMGRSKLKLPFSATATGRNLNTVGKLAALARELSIGSEAGRD